MEFFGPKIKELCQDGKDPHQLCIFFQGLRGSGKSTLCRVVKDVLDNEAVCLDADDLMQRPGAQTEKARFVFQQTVLKRFGQKGTPILLVDFLRLNADARKDLLIAVRLNGNRVNTKYAFYNSLDLR